jgi:outer membrane lipoprotein-sorting protein
MIRLTHAQAVLRAIVAIGLSALLLSQPVMAQDARAILKSAFDNWRADSSHAITEMKIKRSNGTRSLTMESWTQGDKKALVRFTQPARDAGNATLQLGNSTYVFNPKLNQVIKLPASAMTQSWMGSDFSYNDLSRSQKVVDDYTHKLIGTKTSGGKKVFVIEATPKPSKPIVWGKQVISVRSDGVLVAVEYYDQLGKRVRIMTADSIKPLAGRPYPVVMTMRTDAKPGQYTRVSTKSAEFNLSIPAYIFTKSNLQNPR